MNFPSINISNYQENERISWKSQVINCNWKTFEVMTVDYKMPSTIRIDLSILSAIANLSRKYFCNVANHTQGAAHFTKNIYSIYNVVNDNQSINILYTCFSHRNCKARANMGRFYVAMKVMAAILSVCHIIWSANDWMLAVKNTKSFADYFTDI